MYPENLDLEIYLTEIEIAERVQEMADDISIKFKDKKPYIISVLTGAFIFTSDLLRNISIPHYLSFTKIRSYDGTRSGSQISQELRLNGSLKGREVLIIEDIVDTGNTLDFLLGEIKKENPASVSVATLLWKPDVYKYSHKLDFVGFSIPNEFVVGYGMDYNDFGRNLKDIYIFKNFKS